MDVVGLADMELTFRHLDILPRAVNSTSGMLMSSQKLRRILNCNAGANGESLVFLSSECKGEMWQVVRITSWVGTLRRWMLLKRREYNVDHF